MNGRQFRRILNQLDTTELDLPLEILLDLYNDVAPCDDCGDHHPNPYAAIVCDEWNDAADRRRAARAARAIEARRKRDADLQALVERLRRTA